MTVKGDEHVSKLSCCTSDLPILETLIGLFDPAIELEISSFNNLRKTWVYFFEFIERCLCNIYYFFRN